MEYLWIAALSQQPETTKEAQIFLVFLKCLSIHSNPDTTEAFKVHFCVWNQRRRTRTTELNIVHRVCVCARDLCTTGANSADVQETLLKKWTALCDVPTCVASWLR